MRINVYSQELTDEVQVVEKESNTGLVYSAVMLMLHSSPMLHHPPADDLRKALEDEDHNESLARLLYEAFEDHGSVRTGLPWSQIRSFDRISLFATAGYVRALFKKYPLPASSPPLITEEMVERGAEAIDQWCATRASALQRSRAVLTAALALPEEGGKKNG